MTGQPLQGPLLVKPVYLPGIVQAPSQWPPERPEQLLLLFFVFWEEFCFLPIFLTLCPPLGRSHCPQPADPELLKELNADSTQGQPPGRGWLRSQGRTHTWPWKQSRAACEIEKAKTRLRG